jgi:hypothetical protein
LTIGKATRGLRSATGMAAKKLVLLSIVAARAAFGSLAAVATPKHPSWHAVCTDKSGQDDHNLPLVPK